MIDLQTASAISSIVGSAITSIDRMYRGYADYFKKSLPGEMVPSPSFTIQNRSSEGVIVATTTDETVELQKVTYEELRARLAERDLGYVDTLERALKNYEAQWNSAYLSRSMASGMDVGRYEAQLDLVAKEISDPLLRVLAFVERMGLQLDDHYLAAREIAQKYVN